MRAPRWLLRFSAAPAAVGLAETAPHSVHALAGSSASQQCQLPSASPTRHRAQCARPASSTAFQQRQLPSASPTQRGTRASPLNLPLLSSASCCRPHQPSAALRARVPLAPPLSAAAPAADIADPAPRTINARAPAGSTAFQQHQLPSASPTRHRAPCARSRWPRRFSAAPAAAGHADPAPRSKCASRWLLRFQQRQLPSASTTPHCAQYAHRRLLRFSAAPAAVGLADPAPR